MRHPLVDQLRFTRAELERCLAGIPTEDAERRLMPNNSIAWIVGHLANHEHFVFVECAQAGRKVVEGLHLRVGTGQPASTPALAAMWASWRAATAAADDFLDRLGPDDLLGFLEHDGKAFRESVGTSLQRLVYHYWFHIGEAHAIRQQLGHAELPDFVGRLGLAAPYRPA